MALFLRYVVPKLRQRLLPDNVISDVRSSGSTIREYHINTPHRGTLCSSIIKFWQELAEKKHLKKIMTWPLWRHPVMRHHRHHVQWIAHSQVPISCPLEPSRFLASFARSLAPNLQPRLLRDDVISDVMSPWSATVRTMQTYGCTFKLSCYLASFPRYLAQNLRQWLYVMSSSVTS